MNEFVGMKKEQVIDGWTDWAEGLMLLCCTQFRQRKVTVVQYPNFDKSIFSLKQSTSA